MKKMTVLFVGVGLLQTSYLLHAQTFYGADKLKDKPHTSSPYYVQVGSFRIVQNAERIKKQYQAYGLPIRIVSHGAVKQVIIGPISNTQTYPNYKSQPLKPRSISSSKYKPSSSVVPAKATIHSQSNPGTTSGMNSRLYGKQGSMVAKPGTRSTSMVTALGVPSAQWYAQVEGGALFSSGLSNMTVENGSGYPRPYNFDTFTANNSSQGTGLLNVGRTFFTHRPYFTQYAVGLRYQYLASTNIKGTVTQYTMPEFLNYNYTWGTSSNALTADAKLNLLQWNRFAPYANGGLGFSINQSHHYTETALAGVTPRINPDFSGQSTTNFTYHVGAGIDYVLNQAWRLTFGYEYIDLGPVSSGKGVATWASQSLQSGHSSANTALLGVTYQMGGSGGSKTPTAPLK